MTAPNVEVQNPKMTVLADSATRERDGESGAVGGDPMIGVAPAEEPLSVRWRRRTKTIPLMLSATAVGIVLAPAILGTAAVVDLVRGRSRLPTARAFLFLLRYGVNDSVEIMLAPWYWVLAGFGRRLESSASIRRHERVQRWSIATLARSAERLLGVRVEIDDVSVSALVPAPAVVLCRHVSLLDASLPSLLYQGHDIAVRGVIMAEVLADPGFDLFYRRSGSVFVARDHGAQACSAIAAMGESLDSRTVAAIFPEGRLYRRELLDRFKQKIASSDPIRGDRVAGLRHVLPPRPGGTLALLDALPEADVVIIAHAGLDAFANFRDLLRRAPIRTPLAVRVTRVQRRDIPTDVGARVEWLDHVWCEMDDWIEQICRHRSET